jgi:hypothetical protein
MAGVVVGDYLRKPCSGGGDPQYGTQEVGQLKGSLTHLLGLLPLRGSFREQAGKKGLDHGGTRSGWGDNVLSVSVDLDKVLRHFSTFINVAAIEGRLSAAGLSRVEIDRHAALL